MVVADDVYIDAIPASQLPQQRLAGPDPLNPIDRYRLAGQVGQPASDPQPTRRLGQGEVEHPNESPADQRHDTYQHRNQRRQRQDGPLDRSRHHQDHDAEPDGEYPFGGDQKTSDQSLRAYLDQWPISGSEISENVR